VFRAIFGNGWSYTKRLATACIIMHPDIPFPKSFGRHRVAYGTINISGLRVCRNVRKGDCLTNGDEWHALVYTASHNRLNQHFRTGILVGAIRLAKSYKSRYRKRTNRSESIGVCDHASCDVSGQEFTPPKRRFWKAEPKLSEIEHTFGQVGFSLPKSSFGEHRVTKADIARRVTTNRSESVGVCEHASCLVQELQKQISHDDQPFGIGRCTSWHLGFCGYDPSRKPHFIFCSAFPNLRLGRIDLI